MKKVVISGYYGYDNVGDEALLGAIVESLRNYEPKLHITVLSAQPEKTAGSLGVASVSRTNVLQIVGVIRDCDLLISGGGSLLQDVTGPLTIPYYLGIVKIAQWFKKRVMFYAQGVGPVNKSFGKTLIREVVSKVDLITLRDNDSACLLKSLGVDNELLVTADPVFGAISTVNDDTKKALQKLVGVNFEQPVAGIAIRPWTHTETTIDAVAQAADYLAAQGEQVLLIPMHFPTDLPACHQLLQRMSQSATVVEKNLGPKNLLPLVGCLDLIISMRLHALIFAAVQGVPPIGISYDPKVEQFLRTPGCISAGDVENVTAKGLIDQIDYVLKNKTLLQSRLASECSELKDKALQNARLAIQLIK